jgi:hypothetical protein
LWAEAGEHERAIPLLQGSKKVAEDPIGWNHYVDATVAFLRNDRAELEKAREALSRVVYVPSAGLPPLKDGYIEVTGIVNFQQCSPHSAGRRPHTRR